MEKFPMIDAAIILAAMLSFAGCLVIWSWFLALMARDAFVRWKNRRR